MIIFLNYNITPIEKYKNVASNELMKKLLTNAYISLIIGGSII
jgi:hypothetical protein